MTVLTLTGLVISRRDFSITCFLILLDMNSDQTLHSRQFAKIIGKQGLSNDAQAHNIGREKHTWENSEINLVKCH